VDSEEGKQAQAQRGSLVACDRGRRARQTHSMARANLVVDEELRAAFVAALQSDAPLRWLKAELDDVHIKLVDHGPVRGSAQADLDELKEGALRGSGPCFVLFCLNPEADKMAWVLIAFVPDNSKVRARMLYASGQEDVKRTLGFSNFAGSVHATDVDDLDLDLMRGNVKRNLEDAPLTEEELLAKEEVAQMAAPGDARANGMGMVPFQFEAALDAKLKEVSRIAAKLHSSVCADSPRLVVALTLVTTRQHSSQRATATWSRPRCSATSRLGSGA